MIETSVVKCKVYEMAEKIHSHALLNYHLVGILPATYWLSAVMLGRLCMS